MTDDEERVPFWIDCDEPPASTDEIARAEAHIGRELPAAYKRLLREQNGGVSNYTYRVGDVSVPLPAFFSVSMVVGAFDNAALHETPDGIIAIAGGGHDWLGLDYRRGSSPAVIYQEDEDAEIEHVAASFDDLVAGLVVDRGEDY
jgi:hypothetical protein